MVRFYPHTPDTIASGSLNYAQTLLRINYQYFLTGLIEFQYAAEDQIVLLVSEGRNAGAFHIHKNSSTQIEPKDIQEYWKSGNGTIRSVSLPRQAVRASRQVLEWSPPAQAIHAESREVLRDYIETCQAQRANGLFHFLWPRSEGYLILHYGQFVPLDSVFSQTTGTEAGAACLNQILENTDSPCRITFLEPRINSVSYQLQILRIALDQFIKAVLERYTNQLGPGLAKALVKDINDTQQSKSLYIQITGDHFEDTHVFSDLEDAQEAYHAMMKHATVQMYNAAGNTKTHTLLTNAYRSLEPNLQQIIQKYALLPAAVAG